jgi:hypothetical protein
MIKANRKIFVCCPGNLITGGPELLHQLVDALHSFGIEAYISYFPFSKTFDVPEPYKKYKVSQKFIEDNPDNLIIVPESATGLLRKFSKAKCAVWWLSVDNYYYRLHKGLFLDLRNSIATLLLGKRLPIQMLKKFQHYTQSQYATNFLGQFKIQTQSLTDYINDEYLQFNPLDSQLKEDIIAYNPKKGIGVTEKLIEANPNFQFIPIANMTREEVVSLFRKAKLYIDFGHHPGKDRMPREAAMLGCCIITGQKGSALNDLDIRIPKKFKIAEKDPNFLANFQILVDEVFLNYEVCSRLFIEYQEVIKHEKTMFLSQTRDVFLEYMPKESV